MRHTPVSAGQTKKKLFVKQSTNIRCDESLLNYENRYMKVTLKSKLIGVAS